MPSREQLKQLYPDATDDFLKINADPPKDLNQYFGRSSAGGNQSKVHDALVTDLVRWLQEQGFRVNVPLRSMTGKGYRTALQGNKGYFDLTAVHESTGLVIFAEVKTGEGSLSPDQEKWFNAARRNPANIVEIVRPENVEQFKLRILGIILQGEESYAIRNSPDHS